MWKLTSAQEDEVGEQREEETKRQWKGERMGEHKKEDRNAGAWSLLPLRQHCLGTASLSGIINNSAAPVSRLCFMHIRTLVHIHIYIYIYIYILYKYIYLRFSFSISSSSCTLRTFFGYAMNILNTVAWLYLWTGWTRNVYVCVGPFKRDSTRDGEKKNRWNLPRVFGAGRSRLHRGRLRILILYVTLQYFVTSLKQLRCTPIYLFNILLRLHYINLIIIHHAKQIFSFLNIVTKISGLFF